MAKTVAEILKETGMTDEQITALDAKAVTGFTTILSTAEQAREKAELAQRATNEKFETEISPALDAWANDKANYDARIAAYQAALKAAEEGGFKIPDVLKAPTAPVAQPKGPDGKFVAGPTGSPEFVSNLRNEAGAAIGQMLDLTWKYSSLFGKPMPDSPTVLIREAQAQRLDPVTYATKKYGFAEREAAIAKEARQKEIDAAVKDAEAKKDKEWAEKMGSNPDVRRGEISGFSQLSKAVSEKQRPDPLGMSREERHRSTSQQVQKDIAANAESVH